MTCIVGLINKDDNCVYLGSDSIGVSRTDVYIHKNPKIFERYPFAFGFTSSFRMGQILMTENFDLEVENKIKSNLSSLHSFSASINESNFDFMIKYFIPWVRKAFEKNGYSEITNNKENGGIFIVVYNGSLFKIESNFQVCEYTDDYMACGCGESYAIGALYATEKSNMKSDERVYLALEAAAKYSLVSKPFNLIKIENEK